MLKRALICTIVALVALPVFGGGQAEGATGEQRETLQFFSWYSTETDSYDEEFESRVEANVPGVEISVEPVVWDQMHPQLQSRIAAGEMPDLLDFKGQDISRYGGAGHLLDLTGQPWLDEVPPSARENLKVDGKEYGLPYSAVFQGVMYNREIFEEHGLDIPRTYEELLAIAETLDQNGVVPFAAHFADTWNIGNITMQFAMVEVFDENPNWGDDLYAGEVTFQDSPGYRRVFQRVKDIQEYSWDDVMSVDFDTATVRFAEGDAAMFVTGTWANRNLREFDIDYGIFPFPGEDPGARLIFEPNHTWSIANGTDYPEEAMAALEYVANDKELAQIHANEAGQYSLLTGVVASDPAPADSDIDRYKREDRIVDVSIGNNQIKWAYQEQYSRYIEEWLTGQKSLEEALVAATDYRTQLNQ